MTGPVTTEALVDKLAQTMWEQSYGTLANASWAEAHRIAKAIPDGQAAWNIETVRRKASEIVNLHVAPLLAALQQVTAERDEAEATCRDNAAVANRWQEKFHTATSKLARLRAEGEAKDRALLLLLPFVDYAAGEGLMFVETEDGEHPEMDAADIMGLAAEALGLELGSDAHLALLPAGHAAIRAARAATQENSNG